MKTGKKAKPLGEATVLELTDRKCGFCGLNLLFAKVDVEEKAAWLVCPTYEAQREFSKNEHSAYKVALSETGYQAGDEAKEAQSVKAGAAGKRAHHDRPNVVAPPQSSPRK